MEIKTEASQVIEKTVKSIGTSGGIYLPKSWEGKRVKVLLIDEITGVNKV
jgi:putative transposon-encoded protein